MRNYKRNTSGTLALILFTGIPLARGADKPAFDQAAVARGKTQFASSCGFCHGNDASGNRAPDLIRSALVNRDKKGDVISSVILKGRPELGMPAIPLNADQIGDVITFLRFRIQQSLDSAGVPKDYPLSRLLTGNAAAGKAYFEGAGGCAKCHSPTGDLKGIASKHRPLALQDLMLAPRDKAWTATVTLPGGEKVSGTVAHQDEFDVVIRDHDGVAHSWNRAKVQVELHDPLQAHWDLLPRYTDADIHNVFAYLETLK